MIADFIARQLALRDASHAAHWAAKGMGSFARHTALGEFYDALLGKLDEIVEIYQGCYGLVGDIEPLSFEKSDIDSQIVDEANWIAQHREKIAKGNPVIENQLDELGAIYARTTYKLRYLA